MGLHLRLMHVAHGALHGVAHHLLRRLRKHILGRLLMNNLMVLRRLLHILRLLVDNRLLV